jgi:hypothetical protein
MKSRPSLIGALFVAAGTHLSQHHESASVTWPDNGGVLALRLRRRMDERTLKVFWKTSFLEELKAARVAIEAETRQLAPEACFVDTVWSLVTAGLAGGSAGADCAPSALRYAAVVPAFNSASAAIIAQAEADQARSDGKLVAANSAEDVANKAKKAANNALQCVERAPPGEDAACRWWTPDQAVATTPVAGALHGAMSKAVDLISDCCFTRPESVGPRMSLVVMDMDQEFRLDLSRALAADAARSSAVAAEVDTANAAAFHLQQRARVAAAAAELCAAAAAATVLSDMLNPRHDSAVREAVRTVHQARKLIDDLHRSRIALWGGEFNLDEFIKPYDSGHRPRHESHLTRNRSQGERSNPAEQALQRANPAEQALQRAQKILDDCQKYRRANGGKQFSVREASPGNRNVAEEYHPGYHPELDGLAMCWESGRAKKYCVYES